MDGIDLRLILDALGVLSVIANVVLLLERCHLKSRYRTTVRQL